MSTNDTSPAASTTPVPAIIATGQDCNALLASDPAFKRLYYRNWTDKGFRITPGQWSNPKAPSCWIPERATREDATRRLHALLARIEQKRVEREEYLAGSRAAEDARQEARRIQLEAETARIDAAKAQWAGDIREAAGWPRGDALPESLAFARLGNEAVLQARFGGPIAVALPEDWKERAAFLVRLEAFLKADSANR